SSSTSAADFGVRYAAVVELDVRGGGVVRRDRPWSCFWVSVGDWCRSRRKPPPGPVLTPALHASRTRPRCRPRTPARAPLTPGTQRPGRAPSGLLGEDLPSHAERGVGRRDAAVDGRLQQDLRDLLPAEPVAQGAAHVQRELFQVAARDEGG